MRHRAVRHGCAAALLLALLGGCAEALPTPVSEPAGESPAITEEQNTSILAAINAALTAATASRDPAQLAGRLTGPALAVRTSQLQVAAIRDDNELVTDLPDVYQQLIVPLSDVWPRAAFAITDVTDELTPPRLLALVQDAPRDNYRLWAWVQLRPGVTMPYFADPRLGSEQVSADDTTLRFSPADAVAQYADLLTHGDASAFVGNFEAAGEDPFRAFLTTWVQAQEEALAGERVEGTYTLTVTPRPDTPVYAIRTADGGAMAVAALDAAERLEAMEGAVLTPQTKTAQALLEGQEFTNILTAGYSDMVALYIPPADSDQPVKLLGYSHVQTSAAVG